jgi:hypothetical protein
MRKAIGLAAAVLALGGCRFLGFHETSDRDWGSMSTKAGEGLSLGKGESVTVVGFVQKFDGPSPGVEITLRNDGQIYDLFSAEVEFGYPVPAGEFAPYAPEFVPFDLPAFDVGPTKAQRKTVAAPATRTGRPLFARILTKNIRMTTAREHSDRELRRGTILLDNSLEVVRIDGNLTPREGERPTLFFTLENISAEEVPPFRYTCRLYRQDNTLLDLGRRFYAPKTAPKALTKNGETVTIEITGLEGAGSLAGVMPVLSVLR